jgi:hypothetical protein
MGPQKYEEGRTVSNRTIAILASVMAAVSFVHETVGCRVSIRSASENREVTRRGAGPDLAGVAFLSRGIRVSLAADGQVVDVDFGVGL